MRWSRGRHPSLLVAAPVEDAPLPSRCGGTTRAREFLQDDRARSTSPHAGGMWQRGRTPASSRRVRMPNLRPGRVITRPKYAYARPLRDEEATLSTRLHDCQTTCRRRVGPKVALTGARGGRGEGLIQWSFELGSGAAPRVASYALSGAFPVGRDSSGTGPGGPETGVCSASTAGRRRSHERFCIGNLR